MHQTFGSQSYMNSDLGIHSIFVVAAMWTQICNSSEEDNTITDDAFDDRNLIRTLISILQEERFHQVIPHPSRLLTSKTHSRLPHTAFLAGIVNSETG